MTLTILIPDVHLPYEDKRAVANLLKMIEAEQPDRIVQVGDLLDVKAPARWSKGRAEEYAADLLTEAEAGVNFWRSLRQAAPDAELNWLSGNHEYRYWDYAKTYASALLPILPKWPELMKFKEFGVIERKQPWLLAPGVRGIHGKLLSSVAGSSARKEMLRHGTSIVQGHSHRLGVIHEMTDRPRFALEAGWLGDIRRATYLDFAGVANWQQGFGYLYVNGKFVSPGVVPIHAGRLAFHGRIYG